VYVLIETGMRRAAVTKIDIDDVNFQRRIILVEKKGGLAHAYQISREGIDAIRDYLEHERAGDFDKWKIPALFLSAHESAKSIGKSRYFSVSAFNRLKSLFSIL
jgi:site-specific recombinase XerD